MAVLSFSLNQNGGKQAGEWQKCNHCCIQSLAVRIMHHLSDLSRGPGTHRHQYQAEPWAINEFQGLEYVAAYGFTWGVSVLRFFGTSLLE